MKPLNSVLRMWKSWPVSTRNTIIAGFFLVLAAVITGLWYYWPPRAAKSPQLTITDVAPANVDARTGLDAVLWNRSDVPESITSVSLTLSQQPRRVPTAATGTMARSVYDLSGTVEFRPAQQASITGTVQPRTTDAMEQPVSHPLSATISQDVLGLFEIACRFSLREELPANSHLSIVLLLPETMHVSDAHATTLLDYVSGSPPTEFHLVQLLRDSGRLRVTFTVTYAEGKTATYQGFMTFPRY